MPFVPLDVSGRDVGVPPSTERLIVPVGAVVPLTPVIVIVTVSFVFTFGAVVVAESVVVVAIFEAVFAGHAPARLLRSTEPSPVTMS
jgi:hypothetical protein